MVIGIDASRANQQQRTGTEWYSYHVIQGLKTRIPPEHRVIVYSKEPLRGDLAVLPSHWSSKVLAWPPRFLWTQLRLSWEMLLHKPDVLYISAHTTPIISPKKTVSVIHDVGFMRNVALYNHAEIGYPQSFTRLLMNTCVRMVTLGRYGATERDYHRFALNLAVKKSKKIITVSAFSKAEIHDVTHVPMERIHVIPNGLNIRGTLEGRGIFVKLGVHMPYLFFVGRIEEKKNILRLVEAFALLRKNGFTGQLVLAGAPGYGHDRIVQRMKDLGVHDHIVETGWISEGELGALMKDATVFVFPSLYEGFGIPVLEAMHLGVPVACSDIPPLREIAADAAVFFDPRSPENIAKTIECLLPETARHVYAQKGKEQSQLFSWGRTARETWNVLQSVL